MTTPRKLRLSPEERALAGMGRMSLGTIGGQVASASPVRVSRSKASVVVVSDNHNHDGTGVDSTILSGLSDAIQADAQGIQSTAGGDGAIAKGDYSLALGDGADTEEAYGTALGHNAFIGAGATSGTAVGNQASVRASATFGSAFGVGAKVDTGHDSSTAIGRNATTTASNQIMLGTATETVVIPGTLSAASGGGAHFVTSAPSGAPTAGQEMQYDKTSNLLWVWNASSSTWKSVELT